jgi:hypothetical protein
MRFHPTLEVDGCRLLRATAQGVVKAHTGWLISGATRWAHTHATAELGEVLVRTAPAWTGALKPFAREGQ